MPGVTVVDVYEMATELGKELERLMERYGTDSLTQLVPKVIGALELLEQMAAREEGDRHEVHELRRRVTQLEVQNRDKTQSRIRLELELEQLEEDLRVENKDLSSLVNRLQEENRRLSSSLAERDDSSLDSSSCCSHDGDLQLAQKMKEIVDKQSKQLRVRELELQERALEIEQLETQVDNIKQQNTELRRRQRSIQQQARLLIEEKAELQVQLQRQDGELASLRENLGIVRKTNEDLVTAGESTSRNRKTNVGAVCEEEEDNEPRFTMNELRNVLIERNELKARVSELEDELHIYNPKSRNLEHALFPLWRHASVTSSPRCSLSVFVPADGDPSWLFTSPPLFNAFDRLTPAGDGNLPSLPGDEDDLPVQGPINRDPDDAPWRKQESGIRKLFRVLFGDSPSDAARNFLARHSLSPGSPPAWGTFSSAYSGPMRFPSPQGSPRKTLH